MWLLLLLPSSSSTAFYIQEDRLRAFSNSVASGPIQAASDSGCLGFPARSTTPGCDAGNEAASVGLRPSGAAWLFGFSGYRACPCAVLCLDRVGPRVAVTVTICRFHDAAAACIHPSLAGISHSSRSSLCLPLRLRLNAAKTSASPWTPKPRALKASPQTQAPDPQSFNPEDLIQLNSLSKGSAETDPEVSRSAVA